MTKSAFLLPALLVLVSGCVVTYGNFPDVTADALPKPQVSKPVSYHVGHIPTTALSKDPKAGSPTLIMIAFPNFYPLAMKDWQEGGREVIGKTLATSGMFSESLAAAEPLVPAPTVPYYQGLYIEVRFGVDPPSKWAEAVSTVQMVPYIAGYVFPPALILLAPLLFDPIPYYSGEGGLQVQYILYSKGIPHAPYEYTIKKKGWGGLLLLPFAWLNFFTDDLKDALRATTLQFLIDAHRDGNL